MTPTTKHFVTFFSPGTLVSEETVQPIGEWNTYEAARRAKHITERHGSKPYGFRFMTMACAPDMECGDGCVIPGGQMKVSESPMHYLGGVVETLAQVKARAKPEDNILIVNMEVNGWPTVITTTNGYRHTMPFVDGALNLDAEGNVLEVAGSCPTLP